MRTVAWAVLSALLLAPLWARADRVFNVAVGVVQATGEDPDPWIWDVLNNSPLKPAGWDFVNPHNNISGNYWKTNLASLSLPELLDYQLVMITNHQATPFTAEENAKIRGWVAAGGIIWLDDCGNMDPQNFFLPFSFVSYDGQSNSGSKRALVPSHPFFNSVYTLTGSEIAHLGHPDYSSHVINFTPGDWTVLLDNGTASLPDMIVRRAGLGWVIVSSDDFGCAINDYGNPEDIRFAYNILDWARTASVPTPTALCGGLAIGAFFILRRALRRNTRPA